VAELSAEVGALTVMDGASDEETVISLARRLGAPILVTLGGPGSTELALGMSSELMALRHGDSAVRFLATQLSHLPFRLLLAPIGQGTPVVDPDLVYDALLGSSVHFSFFQSVPVTLS